MPSWRCLFAVPPLAALSFWVEGGDALAAGLQQADAFTWAAVAWQAMLRLFGERLVDP